VVLPLMDPVTRNKVVMLKGHTQRKAWLEVCVCVVSFLFLACDSAEPTADLLPLEQVVN
jgi:hypothetical protein